MTTASAPGKIILFGEHAVVYGRPALAVPVTQVHADVEISDISPSGGSDSAGIHIHAPDVDLHAELNTLPSDHPVASVIHNFLFLARVTPLAPTGHSPLFRRKRGETEGGRDGNFPNLHITITSTIPVASGLGSGAAVTVALVRALSAHFKFPMTDEDVSTFTYDIEKLHHGTPSGIDNTVVTYAKPVYFVKDGSARGQTRTSGQTRCASACSEAPSASGEGVRSLSSESPSDRRAGSTQPVSTATFSASQAHSYSIPRPRRSV